MPDSDRSEEHDPRPDSDRADLLRKTLCGATLVMVALSWTLWIDLADFPAVPFVRWFPDYPRAWSWPGLGLIVAGLALGMTRRFGRPGVGLTILVMAWLILGDQLRFQPWVYQFLVMGTLLVVLPPREALTFGCVWMAATYFHSGLSKLDVSFARGMGPLFVRTLVRVLGLGALPSARLGPAAMLMPVGEIVVALLLLIRPTRRLGYVGAVLIHAALLLILGPWGLGHSTIVLVWNGALAVEEYFLFWPSPTDFPGNVRVPGVPLVARPPVREGPRPLVGEPPVAPRGALDARIDARPSNQCWPTRLWTTLEKIVALPFGVLLVLPFGERFGVFDSWPSHALYAGHSEGTTIDFLGGGPLPGELPGDLRVAARQSTADGSWTLNPTDWTRRVRGVPAYPQVRYENALVEWIAGRVRPDRTGTLRGTDPFRLFRVLHRLRADPRTGRAATLSVWDLKSARELSGQFWFNAHPRDWPRR